MPLPDDQVRECLGAVCAFLKRRRPPPKIRDQVDCRVDINGSEVVIVEVRPAYNNKRRKVDHLVAKAKWVAARKVWRLFWMRSDLKWHAYGPMPEAASIDAVLAEVARDSHCCFFG
jgi:hypothetical protein